MTAFLPTPVFTPRRVRLRRRATSRRPPLATVPPPTKQPAPTPPPKPKPTPTDPLPPSEPAPRLSNLQVVAERLSDTLLDAQLHYSRLFTRKPEYPVTGPRVVILGTGWAAHSLVKVLDDKSVSSVTIISPRNFFFFTPLLSATAVGTIEFRSIVEPIRVANPLVDYFEAFATDVDFEKQQVVCVVGQRDGVRSAAVEDAEFRVPYDILVIAVGETTTTFGVEGAKKHAYFLKEISDARRVRKKLLDCLETAALPVWTDEERKRMLHFVVCGGGPTGCEFAGELSDFVANDLAPRYGQHLVDMIQVSLLQSGKSLLTQFETSLQDLALDDFRDRINVVFGARVTDVTEDHVILQNGEKIEYGVLIWAAGNGTRPIVGRVVEKVTGESMETAIAKRRKIRVDRWLRVRGAKNVFALGDCAVVEDDALPSTAQVAGQQGAFLGRLISKADVESINGPGAPRLRNSGDRVVHPFHFLSLGIMAYLGNDRAVVQVEATKNKNLTVGGRLAYALWRSVYAVKQVDVRNRVLVLFDYFKSRVYGRDISQF